MLALSLPPEQPSDDGAEELRLVLAARHKLDGLNVKHLSPVRLVFEHPFEHRLGFDTGLEELENLLDLVTDDGIEDH